MKTPDLFVTNFNPNFTGVSATAAGVVRVQAAEMDLRLVGQALPDCPPPISRREAVALSRVPPESRLFSIWHVRRNPEMRAAIWARDVLRLPIRIVFTSAAQRRHSAYPRWLISRMDAVIATTDEAASFVPNVRAVVPHGVDTDLFHPAKDRAKDWVGTGFPGTTGIAAIGRIRPEKGTDLFVDAMIQTLPERPDVTALVIGKAGRGHERYLADLKTKVAQAGLKDRILFPGEIGASRMPSLMRALSLLVALPRYEGYGMTPLEAMASGVPFVASDTGYFREFSAQGAVGTVVELEDVAAASVAIAAMLDDPNAIEQRRIEARAIACDAHGIDREADGIMRVYEQLWSEASTN